jgi:hypothetical protein
VSKCKVRIHTQVHDCKVQVARLLVAPRGLARVIREGKRLGFCAIDSLVDQRKPIERNTAVAIDGEFCPATRGE